MARFLYENIMIRFHVARIELVSGQEAHFINEVIFELKATKNLIMYKKSTMYYR